ncbi:hypothetical protein V496_04569 [Pseudogymnoascus sp. VKM F-4515 (FW-2607)]|nr:hypothetical protein V496_04569 [Pseudogymnoascus sp. VKM F-4515 (FW-2607)]KFY95701.1 hypothetical protein V498_03179 [Pseudogymnoascus sp. VKM F-4517 (FW-2822)]
MRVNAHHPIIQIRVLILEHRRIKRHGHKQRRHTTLDGHHKHITDLQPNKKRVRHDNRVVVRIEHHIAVAQVQVRHQHAHVPDKDGAHRQDGVDEALIDERVNPAVLHHVPRRLGSGDIRLPVQRNVAERILVEELDEPVQQPNEAPQHTEHDLPDHVTLRRRVLLGHIARLAQELDDGHDEGAEADGAEGVGDGALEGAAGGALGEAGGLLRAEVPGAVDAGDGDVDDVLEDLGDPVTRKGDEDDEPDDLGPRAVAVDAARLVAGSVLGVHGDEGDGEPGAECGGDDAADEGDDEDVTVVLGDVDDGLEHQHREGDAWDPRDEADDVEDGEDQEDDAGGVFFGPEVEARRRDAEDDLQDTGDPDDLLREGAHSPEVGKGDYERDGEDVGAGGVVSFCARAWF